jgi:hypothetical protein
MHSRLTFDLAKLEIYNVQTFAEVGTSLDLICSVTVCTCFKRLTRFLRIT